MGQGRGACLFMSEPQQSHCITSAVLYWSRQSQGSNRFQGERHRFHYSMGRNVKVILKEEKVG